MIGSGGEPIAGRGCRARVLYVVLALAMCEVKSSSAQATVDTMPAAVVQQFVDGANAVDVDAMMRAVAPEAVFTAFPSGEPVAAGRDSIAAVYRRSLSPSLTVTIESRLTDGAFVIDREHIVQPDRGVDRHATWIYHVTGGLIRRAWVLRPGGTAK